MLDILSAFLGITPNDGSISSVLTLPSAADISQIDVQLAQLQKQLAALPLNSRTGALLKPGLEQRIAALRQRRLEATGSLSQNGIPPAPDAPGTFANQLATPKTGLDALTIPL